MGLLPRHVSRVTCHTCWSAAPQSWRAPLGTPARPCWWSPRTRRLVRLLRQMVTMTCHVPTTVKKTRPASKLNSMIKLKAIRSLSTDKWQMTSKIFLFAALRINIWRFVWTVTFTHHPRGGDYVLGPRCMSRSSQVTEETKMFSPPPPPLLWSVAKLTELDNKIISAQDQLYYFLDWTILLTPCIVSLNRHGFSSSIVTSLPVHISQKLREKNWNKFVFKAHRKAATTFWKYIQ